MLQLFYWKILVLLCVLPPGIDPWLCEQVKVKKVLQEGETSLLLGKRFFLPQT